MEGMDIRGEREAHFRASADDDLGFTIALHIEAATGDRGCLD
jgi:hypothetical protein